MYHITKSGEFALCRASVKACPLSGPHGSITELEKALAESHSKISSLEKVEKYPLPASEEFPENWGEDDLEFWEPIKEKLGVYVFQGKGYVPSSPEGSVYYCFTCHARLPKSDAYATPNWKVTCVCGDKVQDGLSGVTLKHGVEKFFHKQAVMEQEWYHYTRDDNWESFLDPNNKDARVVHLGSKEAALDRQTQTQNIAGKLYKLRIKPEAVITDEILEDDPFNMQLAPLIEEGGTQKGIYVAGVTRYFNYYEDPGSMSLIVNPRMLEIIEVTDSTVDAEY